jgi:nitroimidazol reductase NimA-like FMN-containing flavoprotein (pyridoxamine 5'-phosphate oxidase superfamily)
MPVAWSDEIDSVLGADLTAGLGYRTPAGGVVVVAVAPVGLRDRDAGTVGFTTSLGFGRKLERLEKDPRVALAYHAREHGLARSPRYVLVQGRARVIADPSPAQHARVVAQATALLGERRTGRFWDWWLHEYYDVRVQLEVDVDRVTSWPDLRCAGQPEVSGAPADVLEAQPQSPPRNGVGPRVDVARAGRRLERTEHRLLGYVDADGYPFLVPVALGTSGDTGLELKAEPLLPAGGRRAGVLGHSYRPQLVGLEARQYTGWMEVGPSGACYAPHTEVGFKAPAHKTVLLLLNGLLAKRGVRKARRAVTKGREGGAQQT